MLEVPEGPSRGHRGAACTALEETATRKEKQAGEVVAFEEEKFIAPGCSSGEPPPQSAMCPEDKEARLPASSPLLVLLFPTMSSRAEL